MSEHVHYHLHDKLLTLTLDDGKANTMPLEFFEELGAAMTQAQQDGARGVLLVGRPRFFSAGLDLKKVVAYNTDQRRKLIKGFIDVCLNQVYLSPLPVVACIEGHTMAGGAVLMLCADRRIAAEGSYNIGLNEVRVGINMPAFLLPMLRAVLPPQSHTRAILMGHVYDPAAALAAGMVDALAPATSARDEALSALKEMAGLALPAFSATKLDLRNLIMREVAQQDIEAVITQTLTSGVFSGMKG